MRIHHCGEERPVSRAMPGEEPVARPGEGLWARAAEVFRNSVRLRSDRDRHGQDAFEASPFTRLALTHVLSMAGDALVTLALAGSLFFNISLHAARGRVALSLLFTMAPFAIVAPFLGPIIDRTRGGRRLMVATSAVTRAVACLLMARYIHGLLLFPAAFLTLVSSKTYIVAKAALVPATVERPDDLVEANSKLAVSGSIVGFAAAIPGIALLKLFSAAVLLRVDIAVFILCAISALRLQARSPRASAEPAPTPEPMAQAQQEMPPASETAPHAVARPLAPGALQVAAVVMATLRFSVGFMTFLVAFGFRRNHAPAWWYGVILAVSVGGNLVGAIIAPRLRTRFREELILAGAVVAVVAAGVVAINFGGLQDRPAASLLAAVIGVAAGGAKLAFDSLVQRDVPPAAQGRAFGRFEASLQMVWVLGGLVPVIIPMSLWVGFVVITVVTAAAVVFYVVGNRLARIGHLPEWWPRGVTKGVAASPPAVAGTVGLAGVGGPDPTIEGPGLPPSGGDQIAGGALGGAVGERPHGDPGPPFAGPRPLPGSAE
ncbi:MAG TPA: MFS transporter [Acidimicrobiales bacterium]|nr:MFS transporter [Acidimicrobiales bacterium]